MIEIGPDNAIDYLRASDRLPPHVPARAAALAWGVSNVVLRIEPQMGDHFVIKQSRKQLRTEADWFSRLDRIFREMDALAVLAELLPPGAVPRILFEDRANYLFAMQAVPADHVVWKGELLAGRADAAIAQTAADRLAMMHGRSFDKPLLRARFTDREVFDQLRIDPFYRRIAAAHPAIGHAIARLIEEMLATSICLVHADFSPKNMLLIDDAAQGGRKMVLVDFETAHYGDPAFDLGFFFSHLLLKTVLHADRAANFLNLSRAFHTRYFTTIAAFAADGPLDAGELDRRSVAHTAACMLSRVDGKSTVDYLPSAADKELVRRFCLGVLSQPPARLPALFDRLGAALA